MRSNGASRALIERKLAAAVADTFQQPSNSKRETPPISTMASVNTSWHIDRDYVDRKGLPKPLTWNGRRGTLLRLAQKVHGKEKARRTVQELVSRGLLQKTSDGKWLPKSQVLTPSGLDNPQLIRTAAMIERLLRTVAFNSSREYRGNDLLLEVMTRVPRLPGREIKAFKKFVRSQGMIYVSSVDDWLESKNLKKTTRKAKDAREAGVVVYAFEEPSGDP